MKGATEIVTPTGALIDLVRAEACKGEYLKDMKGSVRPAQGIPAPDWRRLLSGSALTESEVAQGLSVSRRLLSSDREIEMSDLGEWLGGRQHVPLFLEAQAGEGKSTTCLQAALALCDKYVVLEIPDLASVDVVKLRELQEACANKSASQSAPPMLLYTELAVPLDPYETPAALNALNLLYKSEFPARVTVLVAGRHGYCRRLRQLANGEQVKLAPLNVVESHELKRIILECLRLGLENSGEAFISRNFPNLMGYSTLDDELQNTLLMSGNKPVLAALLDAAYGNSFHSRVSQEYEALSPADRRAYAWVSLATVAVGGTSENVIDKIAPGANVEDRCKLDPWDRNEEQLHHARHAVIAQTVIERMSSTTQLRAIMDALLSPGEMSGVDSILVGAVLTCAARWKPVSPGHVELSPADIKSVARDAVLRDLPRLDGFLSQLPGKAHVLSGWSRIMIELLPQEPRHTSANLALAERGKSLAERAVRCVPDSQPELRERIEFYVDRNTILVNRFSNDEDSLQDLAQIALRWTKYLDADWPGEEFYLGLATNGLLVLHRILLAGRLGLDESEIYRLARGAGLAYERLRAIRHGVISQFLSVKYSNLTGRLMHQLFPERRVELLTELWEESVDQEFPNYQTGLTLDHVLESASRKVTGAAKANISKVRMKILSDLVDLSTTRCDALLRLATLAGGDPGVRDKCLHVLREIWDRQSGINLGVARHARAVLNWGDGESCEKDLVEAVAAYSQYINDLDTWNDFQASWQEASALLCRLNLGLGTAAKQARKKAENRIRLSSQH